MFWYRVMKLNNSKLLYILGGIATVLVGTLFLFVFKVQGSNSTREVVGCIPYNVEISKGSKDYQAIVEWSTKEKCVSFVVYGDDRTDLDLVSIDSNELSSKNHIVELNSLLSTKLYYFVINSDDINYGNSGIPLSFSLSSL